MGPAMSAGFVVNALEKYSLIGVQAFEAQGVFWMSAAKSILFLCAVWMVMPSHAQPAGAQKGLPALIQVTAGNSVVLEATAHGSIIYVCRKEKQPLTAYKWIVAGEQAVLKDSEDKEIGTYSGPPARWSLDDKSFVNGSQVAASPNGAKNIPFQLVKADVAGGQGKLTAVSYVQRVNTKGGVAPHAKCSSDNDDEKVEVDYQANFIFWKTN